MYEGVEADIRIGRGGLMTDANPADIPDTHLIRAVNLDMSQGFMQKDFGSRRWNASPLASGILALQDYFPQENLQRVIAACRNGLVYRFIDPTTSAEVTPSGSAPTAMIISANNPVTMVVGGNEAPGDVAKLFIFSGNSQVQVITADGITRTNIASPSADWVGGNYPTGGIVHRNRLWVFHGHRFYASDDDDHEQFASGGLQMPVYPGEGDRLISAVLFKGKLFAFKEPFGVYVLNDENEDDDFWYFSKLNSEFGAAAPDAQLEALDDFLIANTVGTVTSMRAVQQLGDVQSGDVFGVLKVANYLRRLLSPEGIIDRRAVYYGDKKIAYFAARSAGGIKNDRIVKIDFSNGRPELTLVTKDQPNCLMLRRVNKRKKPFYGADDGYIYEMDVADRGVAGSGYSGEFQTPHLNFGWLDPKIGSVDKIFDAIQISFIPTGNVNINLSYFIDGIFIETKVINLRAGAELDNFVLDQDYLTGTAPFTVKKKLHGWGKTLSVKIWNDTYLENFKIIGIKVFFQPGDLKNKNPNSGR